MQNPMTDLSPEEIAQVMANCPSLREPWTVSPALLRSMQMRKELEAMRQGPDPESGKPRPRTKAR